MSKLSLPLAVSLLLCSASDLAAETIEVPGDLPTLQAAIDAATAGDKIEVANGTFAERLIVPPSKAGLRIEGSSKTILEGLISVDAPVIDVRAAGTVLEGFTLRHVKGLSSRAAIEISAPDVTLRELKLHNVYGDAVRSTASPRTVVDEVEILGAQGAAIELEGDDVVVRDGVVRYSSAGVKISGNRAVVDENDLELGEGDGIEVYGNDALVRRNAVRRATGVTMLVYGDRSKTKENEVVGCVTGITVYGSDCSIAKNVVHDVEYVGIELLYNLGGGKVVKNEISNTRYTGLLVISSGVTVAKNVVTGCGRDSDEGILVGGEQNTVTSNVVKEGWGSGIRIDGNDNLVADNTVAANAFDGIVIWTGVSNQVMDNLVRRNRGEGIENRATGTVLVENELEKNRLDLANIGSFKLLSGNSYKTGGPTTPPEVD